MKKQMLFKTKGMNRDLSVSAFNPEFSFDNKNLRLSTNENNTMLSWVNEKGTLKITVDTLRDYDNSILLGATITGSPIGTAILNQKLILFTHAYDNVDRIYMLEYSNSAKTRMSCKRLFQGTLNLDDDYPLETLVRYEDDSIQKVYWTDGFNQPRMINIAAPVSTMKRWNSLREGQLCTHFDFIPSLLSWGTLDVEKLDAGGIFAPGVIQYAFTYMNNYGQQSNIIQVSPLYYISYSDRAANPEEKVTNSFKITLNNLDLNFDNIKLYAIQRTSLNSDIIVREVDTLPIITHTYVEQVLEYVYAETGEYTDIALPYKYDSGTWKKVVTVNMQNGEYYNTITPPTSSQIPTSFIGTENVIFRQLNGNSVTFAQFVDIFKTNTYSRFFTDAKYFYYMYIDIDVFNTLRIHQEWPSNDVFFKITDVTSDIIQYNLLGYYIIYDYKTRLWYFSKSLPTSDVNAEEQVVSDSIIVVDNGTTGTAVDPYELLFIGGKEISALTMIEKDGTLFMGNVEQKNYSVSGIQEYFNTIRDGGQQIDIQFTNTDTDKQITVDIPASHYGYNSMLGNSAKNITTFKGGETYRFGFQLQRYTGEWSDPIFIDDKKNTLYPNIGELEGNTINLVCAKASINLTQLQAAIGNNALSNYNRIRPLIVYPSINDRAVLCQGALNPTVFNVEDRVTNTPFAQSSWFFRPYSQDDAVTPASSYDYTKRPISSSESYSGSAPSTTDDRFDTTRRTTVWIMLVQVTDGTRMYVQRPTTITATLEQYYYQDATPQNTTFNYPIITSVEVSRNLFALVSSREFYMPYSRSYQPSGGQSLSYEEFTYDSFQSSQIKGVHWSSVYSGLVAVPGFPLYYIKIRQEEPDDAKILFNIANTSGGGTHYIIEYPNINTSSLYTSATGANVKFNHYETLQQDSYDDGSSTPSRTLVEIQGSKNKYNTVSGGTSYSNSNTQFFIDQSIVTFHSPDIEFDTDVQSFSGEGLALRVIGIVPITGSASFHKIQHSSMTYYISGNSHVFGVGEKPIYPFNGNLNYKATKRLVAEALWNDVVIRYNDDYDSFMSSDYWVYPWQKQGSLCNDWRKTESTNLSDTDIAASILKTKKESTLLYSFKSEYVNGVDSALNYPNTDVKIHLWENSQIYNIRLKKQRSTDADINYYPNIDKVLTNSDGYKMHFTASQSDIGDDQYNRLYYNPISMKYKSGTHAAIALLNTSDIIPILPYVRYENDKYLGKITNLEQDVFWDSEQMQNTQMELDIRNFKYKDFGMLLLGELYRPDDDIPNRFGGKTTSAIKANKWQPAGDIVDLVGDASGNVELKWTYGDTYYQRYDCLKTYAFTNEDTNQLVEILSFMCETHVNADGRYDRNRGLIDNTVMSPTNFNLWNPVYSQSDNLFTYRIANTDIQKNNRYPNQVIWSKTKNSSAEIDLWTNVTLANALEMDGDKGEIKKLARLNDQLICFQDTAISQILYNENVQIASTTGVPIEIANSGKVDGKKYINGSIGCSNKWSVVQTPAGIYFMDSNDKSIYRLGDELQNISQQGGFNSWCKNHIPATGIKWNPQGFDNFVAYYDKQNQDVLFINDDKALAFSEKFGVFTSFYDYGNVPYYCSLEDTGIWIKDNSLWKHQAGDYGSFFNYEKGYHMILVGNPEPQTDKTFTNLEFRASVDGDGEIDGTTGKFTPSLPFDSLEVWDEYQHGYAELQNKNGHSAMVHNATDMTSALKRKFRIWRCDIPRNNCHLDSERVNTDFYSTDAELGISRLYRKPTDRLRNPWMYLKLNKNAINVEGRTEIHDVIMTYYS